MIREKRVGWVRQLHLDDRSIEWFSALAMIAWGLTLAMPGDTLSGEAFSAFHRYGLTESFWTAMFSLTGGARVVALVINGRLEPATPVIRAVGAVFGAVSWAQVSLLVTQGTVLRDGIASTGTGIYALLAVGEIVSVFRAAFDARYHAS